MAVTTVALSHERSARVGSSAKQRAFGPRGRSPDVTLHCTSTRLRLGQETDRLRRRSTVKAVGPGDTFGNWTLVSRLGRGGNGEVWKCARADQLAAMKVLIPDRRFYRERLTRFQREIAFLIANPRRSGVMPLIDSELEERPPWYVMPVARKIRDALGRDPSPAIVLEKMEVVAQTLAALAADGIGHRDIKPDNLFDLAGSPVVGDFGLVTYPNVDSITRAGRRLGPIDYMAPEMRERADEADPHPADVYAFSKALWVLMTGSNLPLPGPHRPDDPAYSLVERLDYTYAAELDQLMARSTRHEPSQRPSPAEVARELYACLQSPPEGGFSVADRGALVARIGALAQPGAQVSHQLNELIARADDCIRMVKEAFEPVARELTPLLPGFSSLGVLNQGVAATAFPRVRAMTRQGQWGVTFTAKGPTENHLVSMSAGMAVRIEDDGETATHAGVLQVESSRPEPGSPNRLYERLIVVPLGSAQEVRAVAELRVGVLSAVDDALMLLARWLAPSV